MAGHINQMKIVVIYDADIRKLAECCKPFVLKSADGKDYPVTEQDVINLVAAAVNVCGILINNPSEYGITIMHTPIIQQDSFEEVSDANNGD